MNELSFVTKNIKEIIFIIEVLTIFLLNNRCKFKKKDSKLK